MPILKNVPIFHNPEKIQSVRALLYGSHVLCRYCYAPVDSPCGRQNRTFRWKWAGHSVRRILRKLFCNSFDPGRSSYSVIHAGVRPLFGDYPRDFSATSLRVYDREIGCIRDNPRNALLSLLPDAGCRLRLPPQLLRQRALMSKVHQGDQSNYELAFWSLRCWSDCTVGLAGQPRLCAV